MSVERSPNSPTCVQDFDIENYWEDKYEFPRYDELDDDEFHLLMHAYDDGGNSLFADPVVNFCIAMSCDKNVQEVQNENTVDDFYLLESYLNHGVQEFGLGIQSATDLDSWEKLLLTFSNNDSCSMTGHQTEDELDKELMFRFTDDYWEDSEFSESRFHKYSRDPKDKESDMRFMNNNARDGVAPDDDDDNARDGVAPDEDNENARDGVAPDDLYIAMNNENKNVLICDDAITMNKDSVGESIQRSMNKDSVGESMQRSIMILENDANDMTKETDKSDQYVVDTQEIDYDYDYAYNMNDKRNQKIWSILTDTLYYVDGHSNDVGTLGSDFRKFANQNPKRQKREKEILHDDDDKYDCINSIIKSATVQNKVYFDPDQDISTTYLWSEESDDNMSEGRGIFNKGHITMSMQGQTTGYLLDGTPLKMAQSVKTLFDTGCSKSMLNKAFYKKHPFLHKYPIYAIKPRGIKIANSDIIAVSECIHMVIKFEGHVFEVIAYLVEMLQDYDFVLGQKTMYELEGGPNFGTMKFDFMMRSIPLIAEESLSVKPGSQADLNLRLSHLPKSFVDGSEAVIKLKSNRKDCMPQTVKTQVTEGKVYLTAINSSLETDTWTVKKGEVIGCVDMRSVGYFHISRSTIESAMKEKCQFLSDCETKEYFQLLIKDTKDLFNAAQQLGTRILARQPEKEKKDPMEKSTLEKDKIKDPYPWLDKEDPRRNMTDDEILRKYLNLEGACISEKEKEHFYKVALKYKNVFSLRDEIGTCPHMEVELELTDTTPFFIRPFPIKETDKAIVDKEMRKGVLLGILKKGMSSYSSPIMLIPRKLTGIPRIVTDFRHLNSRLVTINPSIPLVRDAIQMIGASGCEQLSVVDLRDAYHTLRLSKRSQQFCGITPYYGSDTYLYKRLGMGLSVSPAIWQNFINKVLNEIPDRQHHLAIMDDCLVHSKKRDHLKHLTALFKALLNNGLKISPKKCQLFRQELVYMGHKMMIKEGVPCITPLKTRIEAIKKLGPLKSPKNCKQFCGMVNYMSMFLPDLQKDLIPIYALTKKGMPWHWGEEEQKAYDTIKEKATTPPILVMPNPHGHFILASDTSKIACGSALYQEQKNKYRLVGYYSKKLPDACTRYSICELELTGMTCNIAAFKHLLRHIKFTVYVDHSALINILKAKREPPTLRLQKLIEKLSEYTFNIQYMKGKDMYIADFLSRHPDSDDGPLNEIIPIAFSAIENNYNKHDICNIITRSQKSNQNNIDSPKPLTLKLTRQGQNWQVEQPQNEREILPNNETPRKPVKYNSLLDTKIANQIPRFDIDREYSFPDLLPVDTITLPKSKPLFTELSDVEILRDHIPKQVELDKFLTDLKRKVIHDYDIPLTLKELKAEYPRSPFFKDIYKYIEKDYCRYVGKAERVFKMQCTQYITIKGLLFKIVYEPENKGQPSFLLCVPESLVPTILHQHHDSVLSGHPGTSHLFDKIRKKYFFPGMHNICRQYVISCFECQSRRKKQQGVNLHYPRIPLDYKPMSRISMDLKTMPYSNMGYQHILLCTCEVTNYVMGYALPNGQASTIADVLFNRLICIFGTPKVIICDEASALNSELMLMYLHALNIQLITVSPFNHGSNRTERYIRTMSEILCKSLTGKGNKWPKFVFPACFAMNTQVSSLTGYTPYEMLFLQTPPDPCGFDFDPNTAGLQVSTETYMEFMKEKFNLMKQLVLERKAIEAQTKWIRDMRKFPDSHGFAVGDLVYLNFEYGSHLDMPSRKFKQYWVGPLKIHAILDDTHYLVSDWENKLVPKKVHVHRLKPYIVNLGKVSKGKLETASNLKQLQEKWEEIENKKNKCELE